MFRPLINRGHPMMRSTLADAARFAFRAIYMKRPNPVFRLPACGGNSVAAGFVYCSAFDGGGLGLFT